VPIQLKEIASVDDTFQRVTGSPASTTGRHAPGVYKQSGQNTVNVAEAVLKEIAEIQRTSPDRDPPTSNSASTSGGHQQRRLVGHVGSVLAIMALLVFLVNFRSTLVVALSIPISLIGTIALIYFAASP